MGRPVNTCGGSSRLHECLPHPSAELLQPLTQSAQGLGAGEANAWIGGAPGAPTAALAMGRNDCWIDTARASLYD